MNTLTINNVSFKRSLYQHFLILPKHEAKHEREWKIKTETQHTPPFRGVDCFVCYGVLHEIQDC